MQNTVADPYSILEIQPGASEEDIRNRYLQLVRENPPDRAPEKFRLVSDAWKMICDPLVQARALVQMDMSTPRLDEICDAAAKERPRLATDLLLSLGNAD